MIKSTMWPFAKDNEFYSYAESMEKYHGGITFLGLIGIIVFSIIPLGIITATCMAIKFELPQMITNLLQFIFFILFVWLYISVVEKRSFKSLGFFGNKKLHDYLKGMFIGVLLLVISFAVISFFAKPIVAYTFNFNFNSFLSILSVLGFFIIQGASEEIVMRGWFMKSIAIRHWPWLGILLSTFIFALLHTANPNFSIVAALNIFLIGFLLALLALYDGNLWGACGFHSAWNFTMNSILGVSVSGTSLQGETLMKTFFEGNPIVYGGDFGLEGSIVVTVIVIIACIAIWVMKTPKSRSIQ